MDPRGNDTLYVQGYSFLFSTFMHPFMLIHEILFFEIFYFIYNQSF